jgi:hypothetical protein
MHVAFAVARGHCSELLNAPIVMTLWNLPASIEDQFEAAWQTWLDEPERWRDPLQAVSESGLSGQCRGSRQQPRLGGGGRGIRTPDTACHRVTV